MVVDSTFYTSEPAQGHLVVLDEGTLWFWMRVPCCSNLGDHFCQSNQHYENAKLVDVIDIIFYIWILW